MARHPGGIDVGRVDHVAARIDEGIEDGEARRFVGGPAEHVAAKRQRRHLDIAVAQPAHFDGHDAALADPFITYL